jgi:hypothetical protein
MRRSRKARVLESVLPDQLIAQLLDPEPPVSAKGQNEGLLISEDLLGSQTMRTPTVLQRPASPSD